MFVQNNMRNEFMGWIMPMVTLIGNWGFIWFVLAVILCGLSGNIALKYTNKKIGAISRVLVKTLIYKMCTSSRFI